MSRQTEDKVLEMMLKTIGEHRKELIESNDEESMIKTHATFWMADAVSMAFYSKKYDIEDTYGDDVFRAALTLKVYRILRDVHISFGNWSFDTANKTIDNIAIQVFGKLANIDE